MKIDIKNLLGSIKALNTPGLRMGFPDDPTLVEIADPSRLSASLDDALRAFRDLRGGLDYLVNAEVNAYRRVVSVRFVQRGDTWDRNGQVEPTLEPSFRILRDAIENCDGELHYWGGNNYFDLSLPFHGPIRDPFPDVNHLPWDDRYRHELDCATWESLRSRVFRFSNLAESFATRCVELGLSNVLIPSVGLCIHPWLFADQGLSVVATDGAASALAALSEPDRWPRLYSPSAFERWDIAESAAFATQGNLDHFERMPDLENPRVRESLRQRIRFVVNDWANLDLGNGSVDAVFATNALPRESAVERLQVLREWVRVVRRGGLVFIAQHNLFNPDVEAVLRDAGWIETNIMRGERSNQPGATAFQIQYSSG